MIDEKKRLKDILEFYGVADCDQILNKFFDVTLKRVILIPEDGMHSLNVNTNMDAKEVRDLCLGVVIDAFLDVPHKEALQAIDALSAYMKNIVMQRKIKKEQIL